MVAQKVHVVFEFFQTGFGVSEILDEQLLRFSDVVFQHGVGAEPEADAGRRRHHGFGVNLIRQKEFRFDGSVIALGFEMLSWRKQGMAQEVAVSIVIVV